MVFQIVSLSWKIVNAHLFAETGYQKGGRDLAFIKEDLMILKI